MPKNPQGSAIGTIRTWITLLALALLFPLNARAQGTGRSLDIQPGARQNGMGAAGVALEGNASDAIWWNPAALGFARKVGSQFTYAKLVPGLSDHVRFYSAAGAVPIANVGALGIGFTYLNYGEHSFAFANPGDFSTDNEKSGSLSWGMRILPFMAIGGTVKRIQIKFAGQPNSGLGYDAGGLLRFSFAPLKLSLGGTYQNFGPQISFADFFTNDHVQSPLSRNLKLGGAIDLPLTLPGDLQLGVVGVFDFNQSQVTPEFRTYNGGMEAYALRSDLVRFALRVGYYDDKLGQIQDATFGLGLQARAVSLDAAWIPQARASGLPRVMKLTAGIDFASLAKKPSAVPN